MKRKYCVKYSVIGYALVTLKNGVIHQGNIFLTRKNAERYCNPRKYRVAMVRITEV